LKSSIDDSAFDIFDGHRRVGDSKNACAFAGSRTNPSGELREVVGFVQPIKSFLPSSGIDQVVPFGNEVLDRASTCRLAKGDSAIHATGTLCLQVFVARLGVDLLIVLGADDRQTPSDLLAFKLFESCWLSHSDDALYEMELLDEVISSWS
jgi:hypothetical protein